MSDLRTRIAAAIINGVYDHLTRSAALAAADAVIEELGMQRESDPNAQFRMEPPRHRYVTDWKADSE